MAHHFTKQKTKIPGLFLEKSGETRNIGKVRVAGCKRQMHDEEFGPVGRP